MEAISTRWKFLSIDARVAREVAGRRESLGRWPGAAPGSGRAQPLADEARDLAPVGGPLGLAHHGADDRADRLWIAGADLLGGDGLGLDRRGDDRLQLARVRHLCQAFTLDDRLGVAALR